MKKLTVAYTFAILLPTLLVGIYSYIQSKEHISDQFLKSADQTLSTLCENASYKILITQSISENIAMNTKIRNFLNQDFEFNYINLYEYKNIAYLVANQSYNFRQANIYNISLYTNNESLPEMWNVFLSEARLNKQDWYLSFKENRRDNMWIRTLNRQPSNTAATASEYVYTFVNQITDEITNRYLGIVTLDVLEKELFSPIHSVSRSDQIMYVVAGDDSIGYESSAIDRDHELSVMKKYLNEDSGNFIEEDNLYLFKTIKPINAKIVSKVPMEVLTRSLTDVSRNMVIVVVPGIILLELLTYLIIKFILSRLKYIVSVMNKVSQGDFKTRVVMNQKDEIGQLADDFNILIEEINKLFKENLIKETAQKDAQLKALQYQINPHFIYNTIDIFRMKMEIAGQYDTAKAITDFGRILRYNINSRSKYVTIKEEIQNVEKYINLQKVVHGNSVVFGYDIPEDLLHCKMIKFILQPIVENSIKHGHRKNGDILHIDIKISPSGDKIKVLVLDDGKGIEESKLVRLNRQLQSKEAVEQDDKEDSSIGLSNINDRIALFYGKNNQLRLESVPGEYTCATFYITLIDDAE